MRRRKIILGVILVMAFVGFFSSTIIPPAFCTEYSVWVKSKTCWVVERPSTEAKIVGTISYKASVYVEDAGEDWFKIIFGIVSDIDTGDIIDCKECYIRKQDTSTIPPERWPSE
jgi:hypothetical protein